MFLKKISIINYKLFNKEFNLDNFNIPDGTNKGTGLTMIVGENGCGKTTILDSIAISMLDYKAEAFNIYDFNDISKDVNINFYANEEFDVKGTMPNSDFKAIGFNFFHKLNLSFYNYNFFNSSANSNDFKLRIKSSSVAPSIKYFSNPSLVSNPSGSTYIIFKPFALACFCTSLLSA